MEKINSKDNLIRLMTMYKDLVFSVCVKLTGDYFVAEDITQETFIAAYEHFEDFDGQSEKAWLCRIASNKCIDYKRSAAMRSIATTEEELPEVLDNSNTPLQLYLNNEVMANLDSCCQALSPPYDLVARLHFIEGMTAREIADKTDTNLKTVQTQIYRAKEMLRKSIRKEDLLT